MIWLACDCFIYLLSGSAIAEGISKLKKTVETTVVGMPVTFLIQLAANGCLWRSQFGTSDPLRSIDNYKAIPCVCHGYLGLLSLSQPYYAPKSPARATDLWPCFILYSASDTYLFAFKSLMLIPVGLLADTSLPSVGRIDAPHIVRRMAHHGVSWSKSLRIVMYFGVR